jgi:hypothetical protein
VQDELWDAICPDDEVDEWTLDGADRCLCHTSGVNMRRKPQQPGTPANRDPGVSVSLSVVGSREQLGDPSQFEKPLDRGTRSQDETLRPIKGHK